MPEATKSTETESGELKTESKAKAKATEGYQEEIHRLRARIRELQAKVRDKDPDLASDGEFEDANDVLRDMPGRVVDEASKFARGLTMAYLEQLRVIGEVMTTVTDQVAGRNRVSRRTRSQRDSSSRREPDDRSTAAGMAANLPCDIFAGVVSAVDKSLDGSRRVVDRFNEAYRESDDLDREKPGRESRTS